ncbi:MAG: hypothetical protein WCV70_00250 [Patescibacteria group bacterium]|jgi:hypothetical protein
MTELVNIWFYTLSTSAQVLAALVGLFAVFVVYKLQGLSSSLEDVRNITVKILSHFSLNTTDFTKYSEEMLGVKSDRELILVFNKILEVRDKEPDKLGIKSYPIKSNLFQEKYYNLNNETKTYYEKKVELKEDIYKRLKESLIFGFILISVCILELSFTNYLVNFKVLFFTSIAIVLYMISILKNIYLISAS